MAKNNILISAKAITEYGINIDDIKLDINGNVYLVNEPTGLIWHIVYTPCTKETQTILITYKEKEK